MIPIRDHNPSGRIPVITYLLIGVNSLVFLYMLMLPSSVLERFVETFALVPAEIVAGQAWFTLITSMFLHGSLIHVVSNMLFLNIFGDNLEDSLGSLGYLFFYFVCGLGANLLQLVIEPRSTVPMLGASGAVAGILGGYLVLFPQHKVDVLVPLGWYIPRITLPAYTMLFYWFFAQLFYGVGSLGVSAQGGVAYFAHVGGFITGVGFVWLAERVRG